jgi:aminoglycoside/choline kinase family phosphotransferase
MENGVAINGEFDLKLRLCALQRLMQALGAYGFLGLVRGHKHFLQHIPRALASLRIVVGKVPGLGELENVIAPLT